MRELTPVRWESRVSHHGINFDIEMYAIEPCENSGDLYETKVALCGSPMVTIDAQYSTLDEAREGIDELIESLLYDIKER